MEELSVVWSPELEPGTKSKYTPFLSQHIVFFPSLEQQNCCINSPKKGSELSAARFWGAEEAANRAELPAVSTIPSEHPSWFR